MTAKMMRFVEDSSGGTAVEYAVMTFIAIAIVLVVSQLGDAVNSLYMSFATALQ